MTAILFWGDELKPANPSQAMKIFSLLPFVPHSDCRLMIYNPLCRQYFCINFKAYISAIIEYCWEITLSVQGILLEFCGHRILNWHILKLLCILVIGKETKVILILIIMYIKILVCILLIGKEARVIKILIVMYIQKLVYILLIKRQKWFWHQS